MPVTTPSPLLLRRLSFVALLVSAATGLLLVAAHSGTSDYLIFVPAMVVSALGLGLGTHVVIGSRVPPTLGRIVGAAFTGGLGGDSYSCLLLPPAALCQSFQTQSFAWGWNGRGSSFHSGFSSRGVLLSLRGILRGSF